MRRKVIKFNLDTKIVKLYPVIETEDRIIREFIGKTRFGYFYFTLSLLKNRAKNSKLYSDTTDYDERFFTMIDMGDNVINTSDTTIDSSIKQSDMNTTIASTSNSVDDNISDSSLENDTKDDFNKDKKSANKDKKPFTRHNVNYRDIKVGDVYSVLCTLSSRIARKTGFDSNDPGISNSKEKRLYNQIIVLDMKKMI